MAQMLGRAWIRVMWCYACLPLSAQLPAFQTSFIKFPDLQRLDHPFQAIVKWRERNTKSESLQRDADGQFLLETVVLGLDDSEEVNEGKQVAERFVRVQKPYSIPPSCQIFVVSNHGGMTRRDQQERYLSSTDGWGEEEQPVCPTFEEIDTTDESQGAP
ncbi:hypothetical protein EV421DRAFT_1741018 [Armillaria borealis]|uniref:Secreted protein n=1 Tax=Armillaria borealis TaxID=47425 RepID=A0AA39J140_9AGAR|nr:hypothetical protein EV421DRAFT_1741018 [Armillaria borealis]